MSRTYDIACVDCKKAIWIGQASAGNPTGFLYVQQHLAALTTFLWAHEGHHLVFCDDQTLDDGYEEVEP